MEIGWRRMKDALMTYSNPLQLAGNILVLLMIMMLWPGLLAIGSGYVLLRPPNR